MDQTDDWIQQMPSDDKKELQPFSQAHIPDLILVDITVLWDYNELVTK